jgi:hypothetical protein
MKKHKVLRVIKDKFNLFDSGRIDSQDFMPAIASIRKTLGMPLVQQGFKLGEHYGYYGHEVRSETGKLRPSDVEFIKGVKVNVIPDCLTTELEVSDDGTVSFTQEIYDTEGGKAIDVMQAANMGGWSWATSSASGHRVMTDFAGFDYVKRPNYISTDKALMLASSAPSREEIVSALMTSGLNESEANDKYELLESSDTVSRIDYNNVAEELELMHLASDGVKGQDYEQRIAKAEKETQSAKDSHQALMLACIEALPTFVSEEVKSLALQSMGKPNEALNLILTSVGSITEQDKMMLASVVTKAQVDNDGTSKVKYKGYEAPLNFSNKG